MTKKENKRRIDQIRYEWQLLDIPMGLEFWKLAIESEKELTWKSGIMKWDQNFLLRCGWETGSAIGEITDEFNWDSYGNDIDVLIGKDIVEKALMKDFKIFHVPRYNCLLFFRKEEFNLGWELTAYRRNQRLRNPGRPKKYKWVD